MVWFNAAIVVVVGFVVSEVLCAVDVKDNDIFSGEPEQDLLTRPKKSPADIFGQKKNWSKEDKKRPWNDTPSVEEGSESRQMSGKSDNEVSAEMTALLVEDIKEKLAYLKQLESTYRQLKSDMTNREHSTNENKSELDELQNNVTKSDVPEFLNSQNKSTLESKILLDKNLNDKESLRTARQYNNQYNTQHQYIPSNTRPYGVGSGHQVFPNSGRYPLINIYGDVDDPYLAQYNPMERTFGAAGVGWRHEKKEHEKTEHQSPLKPLKQLKQIIPNVINTLAEITTPAKPVQTISGNAYKPANQPVNNHEHETHKHQPVVHEKKLKGIQPIFFSKQLIFGIGTDKNLNTKNYGTVYPEYHSYPAQSYYPSGYSYYAPASYWTPQRDDYTALNPNPDSNAYYPAVYSPNPEPQSSYDPTLSPYPQGIAYVETPNPQIKTYLPITDNYNSEFTPYYVNEPVSGFNSGENNIRDLSQSQFLMKSVPIIISKNQTSAKFEADIDKLNQDIDSVQLNMRKLLNNTSSSESLNVEEVESSKAVKRNPTAHRRHAIDEEGGESKINKLCYKGQADEKTGRFDFVETDC